MTDQASPSSYDHIPYPDLVHSLTHPGRVAAIATLLNIQPAPVESCRVLELGCASGSNLLAMAYSLPDSIFVGIDNSARQVEVAQHTARQLGLANVTFYHLDILDLTPNFGQFDYIIAHGVYAWVPPHVQDKVLDICKRNLSPQGVAYVSYNTLPGWHMLLMVREMMQYHTRDLTDPQQRATEARAFISQLATMIPDAGKSAYAALLDTYLDSRHKAVAGYDAWQNSVLLHDELSDINEPIYFHEFASRADRHDLQYLAEANFAHVMLNDLSPEAVEQLEQYARDTIQLEQYLDFVRHQTFRRTLLCHTDVAVDRTLRADRIRSLYVVSRAHPVADEDAATDGVARFQCFDGATFASDHPLTITALHYLTEISPRAIGFMPLVQEASSRLGIDSPSSEDVYTLALNLLQAFTYSAQLIELMAYDPAFAIEISERPQASPLALLQVQNVPLVSNLRHEQVELDGLAYAVLRLLDGQHDRAAIIDALYALIESGKGAPPQPNMTPEEVRQALARDLERTLRWMARASLLVG
ncbi:MAG: class I SAM-dependent methyltransferase [Anaerolineae bacterium]|nr:class I SAM-dependent methyltransferase [Anaerolineae bacterium]